MNPVAPSTRRTGIPGSPAFSADSDACEYSLDPRNGRITVSEVQGMNRRRLLTITLGAAGAAAAVGVLGVAAVAQAATTGTATAAVDETTVEPAGGAGLFDVDPDQGNVSQDPNTAVTGDVTALPEDSGF